MKKTANKGIDNKIILGVFICAFLFVLICISYYDFIFGNRLFVSARTASDSYGQFYPEYLSEARNFEKLGFATYKDFTTGLGFLYSNIHYLDISNLPVYFGVDNVADMMLFRHLLCVFIAGVSFYGFIRTMGKSRHVALMAALFYSFCGPILVRQLWVNYVLEYSMFALWLWSFERLYSKRDLRFIIPVTILFFRSVSVPLVYYAVISAYVFFRLIWDGVFIRIWKWLIMGASGIAVYMICSGKISETVDMINRALNSRRLKASAGGANPFQSLLRRSGYLWGSKDELLTLFVRTIGTNTPSEPGRYSGVLNYLEGPAFYCGILTLLCIIPIIMVYDRRRKIMSCIVLFFAACYTFINPLRFISNGMVKDTFKLTSFWITVVVLFIFACGFDELCSRLNRSILIVIAAEVLIMTVIGSYCIFRTDFEKDNIIAALIFEYIYLFVLLYIYGYKERSKGGLSMGSFAVIMLAICVLEVLLQARLCIGKIETITEDTVNDRYGYNDYTIEALEHIYDSDPLRDYRIDKQYLSYGHNDANAQDYYGVTYYMGGMGFGESMANLYESMGVPDSDGVYNSVYPPSLNTYFNTWVGTGYILSDSPITVNYGYDEVWANNGIHILKNRYSIPLAYIRDKYILKDEFDKLGQDEKNMAILDTVILNDEPDEDSLLKKVTREDIGRLSSSPDELDDLYGQYIVPVQMNDEGFYLLDVPSKEGDVLLIRVHNAEDTIYDGLLEFSDGINEKDYYIRMNEDTDYVFEACYPGITGFGFFKNMKRRALDVTDISVYSVPQDIYYKAYNDEISDIRAEALQCESFDELGMTGTINSKKGGILTLSFVPHNVSVRIDGEPVSLMLVDYTLSGCEITPGEHKVEVTYGRKMSYKENDMLWKYSIWIAIAIIMTIVDRLFIRYKGKGIIFREE